MEDQKGKLSCPVRIAEAQRKKDFFRGKDSAKKSHRSFVSYSLPTSLHIKSMGGRGTGLGGVGCGGRLEFPGGPVVRALCTVLSLLWPKFNPLARELRPHKLLNTAKINK